MENVITLEKAKTNQVDVLAKVRAQIEARNVTSSKLAKEIGVSPATVSQLLNDKYQADPSKIIEKLANWLAQAEKKMSNPNVNPGFVMTATAQQITNDISFAHIVAEDGLVVIYGSPGVGKTQTLKEYQRNHNNVWYVMASPSISSVTSFLYELAYEMGIPSPTRRQDSLSRKIRERVANTEGLIIIDEAQFLSSDCLHELRVIQEKTHVAMVLSGNRKAYANMTGKRDEEFSQLYSRIAKKRGINKTKQKDALAMADAWNVYGQAERALMIQISERHGGLRLLSKTLKLASMYSQGGQINEKTLRTAFSELETSE